MFEQVGPDQAERNARQGEFGALFFRHRGRSVFKWVHYLEAYESHFSGLRGRPVRLLEIGVLGGGSLELWRSYFGPEAVIFGIDVDPVCASRVDPPNQVRIGAQENSELLRSVVSEMGGIDVVVDDGSHVAHHQLASFQTLFPLLNEGGLYVIEDLHTSYWPEWGGGYRKRRTAIGLVKDLIDDMHHVYSSAGDRTSFGANIPAIHVYDSIVFIEKRGRSRPTTVRVNGPT